MQVKFGIIGGSGLYKMEGARLIREVDIPTPFGMPSDLITIMDIGGQEVAFLPRHGRGHRILPTEVPSKANIWALKSLGVQQILSISAVGSLVEEYKPGDFVLCTQVIDRTRSRDNSYFGEGLVGHVSFADPFCGACNRVLADVLQKSPLTCHSGGTIITMEGPLFSTRAESLMYRSWNAQVIGMTALPEAKLAREAEICFAVIAMVTDYDCWREAEEGVNIEMILEVMGKNVKNIQQVIPVLLDGLKKKEPCACGSAARFAMMTHPGHPELLSYEVKRKLNLFYQKYWKQ